MILSFKTQNQGKPTHFVEMIWKGLGIVNYQVNDKTVRDLLPIDDTVDQKKLHTIREDPHGRWKAGSLIHFIVFPRSKRMMRFAPIIPCVSTQEISIYETGDGTEIFIDDRCLNEQEAEILAKNDGFEDAEDMLNWFNGGIEGWKIIHWTQLKY